MKQCRTLAQALGIRRGEIVAFVGGGGKTGAILRLIEELRAERWRVLASTTTKVGRSIEAAVPVFEATGREWHAGLAVAMERDGAVFLAAGTSRDGKLTGIEPAAIDRRLRDLADAVLLEADGSRQMPIKAPGAHEPVVPPATTVVVPMVGLDALGRTIAPLEVHRPELLRALTGHDVVTPDAIVRLLTSARGGLKGVPTEARVCPILNKIRPHSRRAAARIARAVLDAGLTRLDRVVVADVASCEFAYLDRSGG